jgi:hypothetical protein
VEIVCESPGAKVSMDNKLLFVAPGSFKGPALAGEHTVVATSDGFISDNKQVVLAAGSHTRISLKLLTLADLTYEKRRFPKWLPWTVTASGVVAVVVGGALHARAKSGFESFDTDFDATCVTGCPDADVADLTDRLSSATWQQRGSYGLYAAGAAAFTTGLVLVFMNQPKTIRREAPGAANPVTGGVTMTPVIGPGMAGVSVGVGF